METPRQPLLVAANMAVWSGTGAAGCYHLPSSCLQRWPWCLLLALLGVKGLNLPVMVARSRLSSPLKVLLTSDCFPHRQREAC